MENILWHFRLLDAFLSSKQLRNSSIVFEELNVSSGDLTVTNICFIGSAKCCQVKLHL